LADQIVPVVLKSRQVEVALAQDEHFRPDCVMAGLAKLKPVFQKEGGAVTAANACGINAAAAAMVLIRTHGGPEARAANVIRRRRAVAGAGHAGLILERFGCTESIPDSASIRMSTRKDPS
jgi:acetyl-CoA C-acetyltransferase